MTLTIKQQQQKPHLGIPEENFERRIKRIPVVGNWISQSKHRTVIYFGGFLFGTGEQIILVSGISGGMRYPPAYPGRVLWRCF